MSSPKRTCYHCGDHCPDDRIRIEDKHFCCRGCKTVFEILHSNELDEYYKLESNPGTKKEKELFEDFSFLELAEIQKNLIDFSDGKRTRVSFKIPAIHCASCIWLLENLGKLQEGVLNVEVNFVKKEAVILFDEHLITLRSLVELLERIGYKPDISLDEKGERKARKRRNMSFIYKLGISGFAFGNIMLLSFPEYFNEGMYDDDVFGSFFGYINFILAIPVFFYCSSSYFKSAYLGIRQATLNIDVPISLGIAVLFFRSSYEIFSHTGPGYFDSMTGLVFFLLVGRWFQNRTYQALSFEKDYKNYFPLGVTRKTDKGSEQVLLKEVKVGDQLIIRNGDLIPADSTLIEGNGQIDYSFVTGESDLIDAANGDALFAGGRQEGGQILIQTEKEFSQSYLMQLWKSENSATSGESQMTQLIDRVAQYFTWIVLLIALATGVYWAMVDESLWLHAVSSVLIIACPCALALCIPFTLGNGLKLLERKGLYLKDSKYIERLAQIRSIVLDKTGTITTQNPKDIQFIGELNLTERELIKSLAFQSNHPLSRAIVKNLKELDLKEIDHFKETLGKGLEGEVDGVKIQIGSASFLQIQDAETRSHVHVKLNGEYKGYFQMHNVYRNGFSEMASRLKGAYEVELMTGDNNSEESHLKEMLGKEVQLYFEMSPIQKRDHILSKENQGVKTLMLGDGLNDAGAIEKSHVGLSISDDIHGFLPACDGILEADQLNRLDSILKFTRGSMSLVKVNFGISFLYNIVGMYFAVQGLLSPVLAAILMPLSSLTVVSFAILSTNLLSRD